MVRTLFLSRMLARVGDHADQAVSEITRDIPAYARLAAEDPPVIEEIRVYASRLYAAMLEAFGAYAPVTRGGLERARAPVARRIGRVSVSDLLEAFGVCDRVLWDAARELAVDDASREVALQFASYLVQVMAVSPVTVADTHMVTERTAALNGQRLAREVVDALLAGEPPTDGPAAKLLHGAGLRPDTDVVVLAARPADSSLHGDELRQAGRAVAQALTAPLPPLFAVRGNEIVAVAPAFEDDERHDLVERAGEERLAIGVSLTQPGLDAVPAGYREACIARDAVGPGAGVLALSALRAIDYLARRRDDVARRMLSPAVLVFIVEDREDGGRLLATLESYVDHDMNAKVAAHHLGVHTNTVLYRLRRIADRTGLDLRRVHDVIELLIAARLRLEGTAPDGRDA